MNAKFNKELTLLFKDAGFETEKTVAVFDPRSISVYVYFKKGQGYPVYSAMTRGGWDVVRYIKANRLLAADFLHNGHYNVYGTYAQIFLPLTFGSKDIMLSERQAGKECGFFPDFSPSRPAAIPA